MHAKHRTPGNGYRTGSAGTGLGLGVSRISPDSSARGRVFYNSDYRNFNNRGFGRGQGQPKSFQQPPQPLPRNGDILMEAGRLAAEYLVSKGLLPQNALSSKWQNDSLKKQVGDFQDIRLQEDIAQEGRTSAHARLGSGASDVGAGRRRYSDDFSSRNHGKGRRRLEYHHQNQSSEWGREYGRSGSWSDRSRVSPDMEEDDTVSSSYEEQQVGEDISHGMQKSGLSGSAPESEEAVDMELGAEYNKSDEMVSKASTFSFEKDGADRKPSKVSDESTDFNLGNEKDDNHNNETEKQIISKDFSIQHYTVESDLSGKHGSDLLTFCKFVKVPTKTRSALTYRAPKVDQVLNIEVEKTSEIGPPKGSEISVQDGTVEFSTANVLPNTNDSKCLDPEIISKEVPVQSADDVEELGSTYVAAQSKCMRSQSFPDRVFMHNNEQELSQGVLNFGRSTSVKERGEKRVAEDSDLNEATKRPREWLPSLISTASDHLHLSNLRENQESSVEEMASSEQQVAVAADEDSLVNSHQFPKSGGDPCADYPQEKQLYPSSFKICDLNLMESSDMNDNHCNDQVLMYPSMTASKTEAAQVDVDLSISNSNLSGEYTRCAGNGNNIEVIDLENDSISEEKAFDNSQRKETAFTGSEGFHSRAQNTGDIADAQDNYDGLISEFLTTFSNCSSVAEDINPLQNEMGLHNGEGTLVDDDSIYMSLEEIPLSFIPAWEQPTPNEYGKPF